MILRLSRLSEYSNCTEPCCDGCLFNSLCPCYFFLFIFEHVCMAKADFFCGHFFALALVAGVFRWCTFSIVAFSPHCISIVKTCACRELSFKKGDAVNIIRQIDNNWYEGEFRGRLGIFPMCYVEVGVSYCTCASFSHLI